ncbi:MAG: Dyp-type peroxidase, partial [Corynebacterium sp.]|nr:Dyp-type peroxidase [Corynebacterium sp.]
MSSSSLSRRGFLASLGVVAAGTTLVSCSSTDPEALPAVPITFGGSTVPFDGPHQAGIHTPPQAHANLIGFNMKAGMTKREMGFLMRLWTEDARRLCAGIAPLGDLEPEVVESPANLTITVGLGASFFDKAGLAAQKPAWLHPIPAMKLDQLDEQHWPQTDIVLQLCCDDPTTLSHATRHMIRAGVDYTDYLWMQQGFLNANGTEAPGTTARNLFGFKDGTVNPNTEEDYENIVWIRDNAAWLDGGSAMVVRRIAFNMDTWEMLDRDSREVVFGRKVDSGAPLTGTDEFDDPDYSKTDSYGLPIIDPASHMARATNPADKPYQKIRRRAYSYDLPPIPGDPTGQTANSGLIFICFQQDPDEQFTPIQQRLDESDRLNQWITHIGSQ